MLLNTPYQSTIHAMEYVYLVKFTPYAVALGTLVWAKICNHMQNKQIARLEGKVENISTQVNQLNELTTQGFQQTNQQLNSIETNVNEVGINVNNVQGQVQEMGIKIDNLSSVTSSQFVETHLKFENLRDLINAIKNELGHLADKNQAAHEQTNTIKEQLEELLQKETNTTKSVEDLKRFLQENNLLYDAKLKKLLARIDDLPTKNDLNELNNNLREINRSIQQLNKEQQENLNTIQQTTKINQNLLLLPYANFAVMAAMKVTSLPYNTLSYVAKMIENK